jgi:Type VI secretion system/phage-baseplate injector OB domain
VHALVDTIRGIARDEARRQWHPALGVVTSLHGRSDGEAFHACTVRLRETGLVLPKVPLAVGLLGVTALPQEGDLVVVAFAQGDLHAPVVVGRLYDERTAPPEHGPGELVAWLPGGEEDETKSLRLTVSTPGDGSRLLELALGGSVPIEVAVDDEGVRLATKDALFTLRQSGGSDAKAELTVGQASIAVEQNGNVTVEAGGTLTLKGAKVEISGDATVKVAGQTIQLN